MHRHWGQKEASVAFKKETEKKSNLDKTYKSYKVDFLSRGLIIHIIIISVTHVLPSSSTIHIPFDTQLGHWLSTYFIQKGGALRV